MSSRRAQRGSPRIDPVPPRAIVAIVTTALGLILLFSFRTPDSVAPRTAGAAASQVATVPGQSSRPASSTRPGPSAGTAAPSAAPVGGSPAPRASGNGGPLTTTGDDVPNQFGDVQVQVTFAGGTITDVKALQLPFDRRRSAEISQYVEPYLRSEALQAQSAQIDLISGATYTSTSYAQSLQSAIDKAHG